MAIITISRQFGSNGETIAEVIAETAGFVLLNKKTLTDYVAEHHIPEIRLEWINESSPNEIQGLEEERLVYTEFLKETITGMAKDGHVLLLGRGGQFLFKDQPDTFHIKVIATLESRTANIQRRFDVDKATALRLINEKDAERTEYALYFHRGDWNDPEVYDLVLNTSRVSLKEAAEIILFFLKEREIISAVQMEKAVPKLGGLIQQGLNPAPAGTDGAEKTATEPGFANRSEKEFARILDYYQIKYLYEPTTFPLKWDSEGNVESAFTPDFYFPDFDLYIELTTMKQDLVTKKNRKLREMHKLYPDVNIKLFYRKDYRKLLEKFGLQAGIDEGR